MKALIGSIAAILTMAGVYFTFFNTVSGSMDFVRVSNAFVGVQSMGGLDPQSAELAAEISFRCKAAQNEAMMRAAQEAVVDLTLERINVTRSLAIGTFLDGIAAAAPAGATPEQSKCLAALTLMKVKFPETWSYVEKAHETDLKLVEELIARQ